ncbi:Protein fmp32, mitochondrial [Blastocladiella emersonii ATCC 22665]|nr:Protein fmp32, mitochondrial [Blastocladiella emersonii ATCC 22665]
MNLARMQLAATRLSPLSRFAAPAALAAPGAATVAGRRYLSTPPPTFDTYKFVQRLEQEGFSREQSEAIMQSFLEVISESMANLKSTMVTKGDQEKNVHMYKVDFTALKSEIKMLEKNDFAILRSETERLTAELDKLKQKMREETNRLQAGVRLDMNLEKGRIRDETSIQETKIREADARIETEIANIRTQLESIKYEIIRNVVGTLTAAGGLVLAYMRFLH